LSSFWYRLKYPGICFASLITEANARGFGMAGELCGVPGSVVGRLTVVPVLPLACGLSAGAGAGVGVGVCFCANAGAESASPRAASRGRARKGRETFMQAPVDRCCGVAAI